MKLGHPDLIFLYFLLPFLLALLFWRRHQQIKSLRILVSAEMQKKILPLLSPSRFWLKNIFKVLTICFLILALAEPMWGMREEEVKLRGIDLMLLADVSNSMLAEDLKPSRLEVEKRKLKDLIQILAGDRVGLVAFAGRSFLLSPLTIDYNTLEIFIDDLNTETIPIQGTDLTGALDLAMKAMGDAPTEKAILLFTDGEDHSEKLVKTLELLREKNIRVFVLGFGSLAGAPIPDPDGGFKKNLDEDMVVSKLNEVALQNLALSTGGAYVRAVSGDQDLEELYIKGVRGVMNPSDLKISKRKIWESRFYWPLALAVLCLILESLLAAAARPKPWRFRSLLFWKKAKLALALIFFGILGTEPVHADPLKTYYDYQAAQAYKQKHYAKAKENFNKSLNRDPSPQDFFNLGMSQYRLGEFASAEQSFKAALQAGDPNLKERSFYNLGNTLYREGRLEEALQAYASALKLQAHDAEAKLNYEFVKKKLKEKKQEEEKKQEQQAAQEQGEAGKQDQKGEQGKEQNQAKPQGGQGEPEQKQNQEKQAQGQPQNQQQNEESKPENQSSEQKQNEAKTKNEGQAKDSQSPSTQEQAGQDKQEQKQQQADNGTEEKAAEPKDLQGQLSTVNEEKQKSEGKPEQQLQKAGKAGPEQEAAARWLDSVEDHSQAVREQQIRRALGSAREPEKDW